MFTVNQIQPLYQLLSEHSSDIFLFCDLDFKILEFNPAAEKYYGLLKQNVVGHNYLKICMDPGILSSLTSNLAELNEKIILSNISSAKVVDGFKNIFKWKIISIENPDKKGTRGFLLLGKNVTNITKENHRENLDFYLNLIISKLPGNFYWKNKEGIYQGCAEDLLKTANLKRDMVVGKTDEALWPAEVAQKLIENDKVVLRQNAKLQTVENILTSLGKQQYFITVKIPLTDLFGETIGIIGNSIDITDQIRAETQLKKEQENLRIANQAKMEFLLNMRHDLRTPFSGILGFSTYLAERETDPTKKEQLGYIQKSSTALLKMIDEIFESFQIEHDLNAAVVEQFSIKEVISTISTIFLTAVKNKGLTFIEEYDPNIPKILLGFRTNILRLLINLIGNAIKFTEKGRVILSTKLLSHQQNECILEFSVKDTGIGIPAEKHEFIFEKFSKVNPSYEGGYHGIGLGLSIVKEIVDALGGKIRVESALGVGSTFYCTLAFQIPSLQYCESATLQVQALEKEKTFTQNNH